MIMDGQMAIMMAFFLCKSQGREWILSLALARETAKERASWEKADRPMGKSVTKITVPRMYPAPVRVLLKLESLRYALPAHEFSFFYESSRSWGQAGTRN